MVWTKYYYLTGHAMSVVWWIGACTCVNECIGVSVVEFVDLVPYFVKLEVPYHSQYIV